jgi:ACS family tartrate transporter-like MFS transporter
LGVSGFSENPTIMMIALIAAAIGTFCTFAVFWTLPTAWLSGTAAAGGIALINSIGNLAGFGGPYLVGWIKDTTGSTTIGLLVLAVMPLLAACLALLGKDETMIEFVESSGAK